MSLELVYFRTATEMIHAAAAQWVRRLHLRNKSAPYGVALSGGRVAKKLFEGIALEAGRASLDWSEVHFFWADERCVPPNDPESNFAIAQSALFEPCAIPSTQIHRIHGEVDPTYAAREAEAEICRILPLTESGQPVLDMVFLGMGEDGHVASLFPEEGFEFTEDKRVYRHVIASKLPRNRITLGYEAITAAKEAWVVASGEGKRAPLESAARLEGDLPIVRVVKKRAITVCFNDIVENF
jgi:6-phosphogluconolactonase